MLQPRTRCLAMQVILVQTTRRKRKKKRKKKKKTGKKKGLREKAEVKARVVAEVEAEVEVEVTVVGDPKAAEKVPAIGLLLRM